LSRANSQPSDEDLRASRYSMMSLRRIALYSPGGNAGRVLRSDGARHDLR